MFLSVFLKIIFMNTFFNNYYISICDLITEKKLSDAFLLIEKYIDEAQNRDIKRSFEKQKETECAFPFPVQGPLPRLGRSRSTFDQPTGTTRTSC